MAVKGPIPVHFDQVFPFGTFLASEVTPVMEFENGKPTKQKAHPVSGEPVWEIAVIDGDSSLKASQKTVKVKLAAKYQPVPPDSVAGSPFTPVEFTEMTITPYLVEGSGRPRIAYSIQARDMLAAGAGVGS